MSERRDLAMITALETVMGEMGDMRIPISALWLERLIRRAGVDWEIYDHEEPREVEGCALGALCQIARRNMTYRQHDDLAPAIEWTPDRNVPGAYRVGHSQPPHVADGMVAHVCIGDGAFMEIPNPQAGHHGSIGWVMTWGNYQPVRLTARSLIESYTYLISGSINMKEATHRLRLLRNAYRSLALKEPHND
jgi:hypothetical protein